MGTGTQRYTPPKTKPAAAIDATIHHAAAAPPQRRHGDAADRLRALSSQRRRSHGASPTPVKAGYAHFDGAAFYDNEREAGRSLTEACWYTTKVWTTDSTFEDVASVKRSRRVRERSGPGPGALARAGQACGHVSSVSALQGGVEHSRWQLACRTTPRPIMKN